MSRLSTLLALVVAAAVSFTGLAYRRPAAFRVDIGGDDTAYVQHFNEREGQGDAWRWSRRTLADRLPQRRADRSPRSSAHRFLLAWLVGSLVPGLVTVSAPSALRAVEAAAPT
jgi:hypothetical protein